MEARIDAGRAQTYDISARMGAVPSAVPARPPKPAATAPAAAPQVDTFERSEPVGNSAMYFKSQVIRATQVHSPAVTPNPLRTGDSTVAASHDLQDVVAEIDAMFRPPNEVLAGKRATDLRLMQMQAQRALNDLRFERSMQSGGSVDVEAADLTDEAA